MEPEVPTGFIGYWATASDLGLDGDFGNARFNHTVPTSNGTMKNNIFTVQPHTERSNKINKPWLTNVPLKNVVTGCPGTCKAKILAPALMTESCAVHSLPVNYTITNDFDANKVGTVAPPFGHYAFLSTVGIFVQDPARESINLVSEYADINLDCEGTLHWSACSLQSAIGEYEVLIETNAATVVNLEPRINARANNAAVSHDLHEVRLGYSSTLASIAYLGNVKWAAFVAYYNIDGITRDVIVGDGADMGYIGDITNDIVCPTYSDPQKDIVKDLNGLMVYIGIVAAQEEESVRSTFNVDPGLTLQTTTDGFVQGEHAVFHVDFRWFAAAATVEILCVLLSLPTYWRYWELGRSVSFSPLELAKAFESPILQNCRRPQSRSHVDI